jgi:hypothetical protein
MPASVVSLEAAQYPANSCGEDEWTIKGSTTEPKSLRIWPYTSAANPLDEATGNGLMYFIICYSSSLIPTMPGSFYLSMHGVGRFLINCRFFQLFQGNASSREEWN